MNLNMQFNLENLEEKDISSLKSILIDQICKTFELNKKLDERQQNLTKILYFYESKINKSDEINYTKEDMNYLENSLKVLADEIKDFSETESNLNLARIDNSKFELRIKEYKNEIKIIKEQMNLLTKENIE